MDLLPEVTKALEVIKPPEQRLVAWQGMLTGMFKWETENLQELLIKVDFDGLKELILTNPTIEDLPKLKQIDDKLKEIKSLASKKKKERLDLTGPLDSVKKRLMIIEEGFDKLAEKLSTSYIALKKIDNAEQAKKFARDSELNQFRTRMEFLLNDNIKNQNLYIESKITEAYEEALEFVEIADIVPYKNDILFKHTEKAFQYLAPKFTPKELNDPDLMKIYKEVYSKWDADGFSKKFHSIFTETFSDFEIAKGQKEEALRIRKSSESSAADEIVENQQIEDALVLIEEKSFVATPPAEITRDLKVSYEIDMEHTPDNMVIIEKAFYANRQKCFSLYRGKDCWNMNTVDKGNLLCAIKKEDSIFEPQGVIFKVIDKI